MIRFLKNNVVKLNAILFCVIFIISVSIVLYRLHNPEYLLEQRACMDRLNMIAIEYAKYHEKNNSYPEINELFLDPNDIFLTCPVDRNKFMVVVDESGYKIKCNSCKIYIENNILKRE